MSNFWESDPVAAPVAAPAKVAAPAAPAAPASANFWEADPVAAAPAPAAPAYDKTDPRFQTPNMNVRAGLRGIPLAGAFTSKLAAGLGAAAGVGSTKSTIAERYVENLAQEEAAKADYEKNHPVQDAVAGTIGGTLALGGAGGAFPAVAKALGMTGTVSYTHLTLPTTERV